MGQFQIFSCLPGHRRHMYAVPFLSKILLHTAAVICRLPHGDFHNLPVIHFPSSFHFHTPSISLLCCISNSCLCFCSSITNIARNTDWLNPLYAFTSRTASHRIPHRLNRTIYNVENIINCNSSPPSAFSY